MTNERSRESVVSMRVIHFLPAVWRMLNTITVTFFNFVVKSAKQCKNVGNITSYYYYLNASSNHVTVVISFFTYS